jgi:hypothetical protein
MQRILGLVLALALFGCSQKPAGFSAADRAAISAAIQDAGRAAAASFVIVPPREGRGAHGTLTNLDRVAYLTRLKAVSTTDCPQDFRLAFLNYVQTLERANEQGTELPNILAIVQVVQHPAQALLAAAPPRPEKVDVSEAWRQVVTVATKYGAL